MTTKESLRRLVNELPESELDAARRYLEYLRDTADPLMRKLLEAPKDDEPTTPEEDEAVEEAWREYLRGEFVSAEEAKRELLS